MSLYATISSGETDNDGGDIATNSGWLDFGRWVAVFDGADELLALAQHGQSEDADALIAGIDDVIENGEPTPEQKSIAGELRRLAVQMRPGDVLTISDGTGVTEDG